MTKNEWLDKCRRHDKILIELVDEFYPVRNKNPSWIGPITAPNAQSTCDIVCSDIVNNENLESTKLTPRERFIDALDSGNINTLVNMPSSTWFGVPESTGYWRIPGFSELVDLIDDFPEYHGDENGI